MSCAIHARDLRFTYPNGVVGLDGVDLHVTHGERVAVLGPNGAGKTTLMLQLNALLTGEGELEVAGLRVGRDDVRDLRARVGLVFQDPDDQLFMPTVREDVAFGPLNRGCSRERGRGPDRRGARRRPHAASSPTARRTSSRSASAGAWRSPPCWRCGPSLLVLDEPSANLDPRTRRELIELLDKVERTMLVVTHDLPLAATLCERAVILSAGRIVADGPCPDILGDTDLLAAHDLELPEGFDLGRVPLRA